jgi:hypothetical protein
VTLAQIVRRAVEVVDPDDIDPILGDYELAFEDADEPARAVDDVEERVATVLAELDPAVENASLSMAGAVTTYLRYRRDALQTEPDELLRLAARAEWDGDPPANVVDWLTERGIRV